MAVGQARDDDELDLYVRCRNDQKLLYWKIFWN